MSWAIGYDDKWKRDIGYGVPAYCDYPGCRVEIDRGLSYVCGGEPYGGDHGCGLYFCSKHLFMGDFSQCCERCLGMQCDHDFVPPGNDDELQCDSDCRYNWHKCSECGKSRHEVDLMYTVPFEPKKEHPKWLRWKLRDHSWAEWRKQNPELVKQYREELKRAAARKRKASADKSKSTQRESKRVPRRHRKA